MKFKSSHTASGLLATDLDFPQLVGHDPVVGFDGWMCGTLGLQNSN
jgi:hypothetical protein